MAFIKGKEIHTMAKGFSNSQLVAHSGKDCVCKPTSTESYRKRSSYYIMDKAYFHNPFEKR